MKTLHLSVFIVLCLGVNRFSSEVLQRQKRNWIIDSFSIDEGYKGPYPYILGKVSVEKDLSLFEIHGQGVDKDPIGLLVIDEISGEIRVNGPVDFERHKKLLLTFQARDRESQKIDTRLGLELQIIDANDNPPVFDHKLYTTTIKESLSQGELVITISATDLDKSANGQFDFRIVSVTPKPDELEFYFSHTSDMTKNTRTATISFKGCLDHEKAEAYTIIVEAKDRGEEIQLSSSCTVKVNIEDGNNHIPVVTGITGPGKVREGETNVLVSRLQVKDEDTKGSAAWRVKYKIYGDPSKNFRITTDPDTNDGLLYAEKHLSYEDGSERNLTISLENEVPYHSCKVVHHRTTDLWEISQITGVGVDVGVVGATGAVQTLGQSTQQVTVIVEDVNEAPIFNEPNKKVQLTENSGVGKYLSKFKATDPDVNSANTFIYKIGDDPADWVTVDDKTGVVKTKRDMDRESPFVKDGIYVVTVLAIDDGKPPMTGTATLSILVNDENDNAPNVTVRIIDMCHDNKPSKAEITVVDLDEKPFNGPFTFKLHGDVKGKWRIEPEQGNSVHLVKEMTVHSGHHELVLEVFDLQDKSAVHNLSVTVCDCKDTAKPNCRFRKAISSSAGGGASLIIFFSILMFAGMLLMTILLSCKRDTIEMPLERYEQSLMAFNTEKLGDDTSVDFDRLNANCGQLQKKSQGQLLTKAVWNGHDIATMDNNTAHNRVGLFEFMANSVNNEEEKSRMSHGIYKRQSTSVSTDSHQRFMSKTKSSRQQTSSSFTRGSTGGRSTMRKNRDDKAFILGRLVEHGQHSKNFVVQRQIISQALIQKLEMLQEPGVELHDYIPHVYAEEGAMEVTYDLDAISIQDISFDPDLDLDLDSRFSTLALICMPQESIAYSTKTSCVTENIQMATVSLVN